MNLFNKIEMLIFRPSLTTKVCPRDIRGTSEMCPRDIREYMSENMSLMSIRTVSELCPWSELCPNYVRGRQNIEIDKKFHFCFFWQ